VLRRFVLPTLVGSLLFYIILRPFGRWLAFKSGASDVVYAVTIWLLMIAASFVVSFLVARSSRLRLSRALVATGTSTIASVLVLLAAAVLVQRVALGPQWSWMYSEPASLSLTVLLPAAVSAITIGVVEFGRPRPNSTI
jgi:hypothetical protein